MDKGINYANRGQVLENMINMSNDAYLRKGIAVVQKIPIPITILKKSNGRIVNGFIEKKSTLDYVGVYDSIPIAFDAKETKELNRFPLTNIADHQIKFMNNWCIYGGIPFLIVSFSKLDKIYRLDWTTLNWYWNAYQKNKGQRGFGSIPLNEFEVNCKEIKSKNGIVLDYLEGIR